MYKLWCVGVLLVIFVGCAHAEADVVMGTNIEAGAHAGSASEAVLREQVINAFSHAFYGRSVQVPGYVGDGGFITLGELAELMEALHPTNVVRLELNEYNMGLTISQELFGDIFLRFISQNMFGESLLDSSLIAEESHIILASGEELPMWASVTDIGGLYHPNIHLHEYLHTRLRMLVSDGEVLALLGVSDETPTLENALVLSWEHGAVRVFAHGVERLFSTSLAPSVGLPTIADVRISRGNVLGVDYIVESTHGDVLRRTPQEIELRDWVTLQLGDGITVYSTADGHARLADVHSLTVGLRDVSFFLRDGVVSGALITTPPDYSRIRVALHTTNFESLLHESITVVSETGITMHSPVGDIEIAPSEELVITSDSFPEGTRFSLAPNGTGAKIQLRSVTRHGGNVPSYRGVLDVLSTPQGFHVVNDLDMEEYLWGVIPSEMPSSFGEEAARVQAVTARSYAAASMRGNRFTTIGANICDSVNSQVYNNIPETSTSIAASNYTAGMLLVYDGYGGLPITANYFAVSSGHTAMSGDVWARGGVFPADTPGYLVKTAQHDGDSVLDMTIEEVAREFLMDWGISALDMHHPLFRWRTELTSDEVRASIDANLFGRFNNNPALILTLQEDGTYASVPIDTVGNLEDIEVVRRGIGGNIKQLRIVGDQATILVKTELNIRSIIQANQFIPGGRAVPLERLDGSVANNHGIMPSAFYTIERLTREDGTITAVRFSGGGFGHGVGMSQAGVYTLANAGIGFADILMHFYPGARIEG